MINEVIIIFVLVLAIPTGYLIAYLCRDELIIGRKWFKRIIMISTIGFITSFALKNYEIALTFIFIFIVSFISLKRSNYRKWTSKKIE